MILVSTYVIGLTEKSFEVELVNDCRKLVNIGLKKCSCGRWQLNKIPYSNACAAIHHHRRVP